MIVELNTNAFEKAKNGDLFIVEEKNGKKYASPVSKKVLLSDVYKQLEDARKEILKFKKIVEEQRITINNFKDVVNHKLVLITKILGGYSDE